MYKALALGVFILGGALAGAASPARADDNYPVCIGRSGLPFDCRFTSIAQCQEAASGQAASCFYNPFLKQAAPARPERRR